MGKANNTMLAALMSWDGTTRVWNPTGAVNKEGQKVDGVYGPKAVTGELIRVEEWETDNGPCRVAIIVDDNDANETAVYTNSVTISKQWEDYRPRIGDRIGIAFGGSEEGKNGRTYNRYKLMVERCQHNGPDAAVTPPDEDVPFKVAIKDGGPQEANPATGEIVSKRKPLTFAVKPNADPFTDQ